MPQIRAGAELKESAFEGVVGAVSSEKESATPKRRDIGVLPFLTRIAEDYLLLMKVG